MFGKFVLLKNDLLRCGGNDSQMPTSYPPSPPWHERPDSTDPAPFLCSSSLYKAPWARVLVYGLGHKVKRNGQLNLIEAVCYPRDASPANTGLTPPPTANQYPSVILSTDKVHIKLGMSLS